MTMTFIDLTPTELKVIKHRLDVPEAIAEALSDGIKSEAARRAVYEIILDAASIMERRLSRAVGGIMISSKDGRAVIIDAVEGSTLWGITSDMLETGSDSEQREARGLRRAMKSVEKKLAEHGINAEFPRY